MQQDQTITITVPGDVAERIQAAVARGEFASASELVQAALRQWSDEPSTDELRSLWREGVESGAGRFASIEEIKAEGRRRLAGL